MCSLQRKGKAHPEPIGSRGTKAQESVETAGILVLLAIFSLSFLICRMAIMIPALPLSIIFEVKTSKSIKLVCGLHRAMRWACVTDA